MGDGHRVRTVPVSDLAELRSAVRSLARPEDGPVIVLVGGASGLAGPAVEAVARLFREHLVPALDRWGGLVVDGGTDAGVMQLIGQARAARDAAFMLVGVAAAGTVRHAGQEDPSVDTELEPNHSVVLLVPGDSWGDEAPWIAAVPTELAPGRPSATLLVNGGSIAFDDADLSIAAGRWWLWPAAGGRATRSPRRWRGAPPRSGRWHWLPPAWSGSLSWLTRRASYEPWPMPWTEPSRGGALRGADRNRYLRRCAP
jgi:hypothetical protein